MGNIFRNELYFGQTIHLRLFNQYNLTALNDKGGVVFNSQSETTRLLFLIFVCLELFIFFIWKVLNSLAQKSEISQRFSFIGRFWLNFFG